MALELLGPSLLVVLPYTYKLFKIVLEIISSFIDYSMKMKFAGRKLARMVS